MPLSLSNTYFIKLFILCIFLINLSSVKSMTRDQLKTSGKLLKKTCMPKNGVTEEQVGEIEQGKFLEERNVMCYISCIYSTGQVIKNNKFQHDAMIKQVDMMFPTDIKDAVKAVIEQCKGIENNTKRLPKKYKDICEASYWTAKCMYDADPSIFVFP